MIITIKYQTLSGVSTRYYLVTRFKFLDSSAMLLRPGYRTKRTRLPNRTECSARNFIRGSQMIRSTVYRPIDDKMAIKLVAILPGAIGYRRLERSAFNG